MAFGWNDRRFRGVYSCVGKCGDYRLLRRPGPVSGSFGCNRYTGPAIHADEGLSFGAVAGTRMMCSDSQVMAEESRYLDLLARVGDRRISVGPDGKRVELLDAEEARIMEFSEMS